MYEGFQLQVFVQDGCEMCDEQKQILASWRPPCETVLVPSDPLSDRAGVDETPTLILMRHGQEVTRHIGLAQPMDIMGMLAMASI